MTCKRGHESFYQFIKTDGYPACRECAREDYRRHWRKTHPEPVRSTVLICWGRHTVSCKPGVCKCGLTALRGF